MVVVRRVFGHDGGRDLRALGDFVGPVRYASLSGHKPLISLGRVVVFRHVLWVGWWDRRLKLGEVG